jgi:hypothetical protein
VSDEELLCPQWDPPPKQKTKPEQSRSSLIGGEQPGSEQQLCHNHPDLILTDLFRAASDLGVTSPSALRTPRKAFKLSGQCHEHAKRTRLRIKTQNNTPRDKQHVQALHAAA